MTSIASPPDSDEVRLRPSPQRTEVTIGVCWVAAWIAYWILSGLGEVPAALAVQAGIAFGCCVRYAYRGTPMWAAGAITSLVPLLAGITPYGHASAAARTVTVSGLVLLVVVGSVRDRALFDTFRSKRAGPSSAGVLWVERVLFWVNAGLLGVVLGLGHPIQVLPIGAGRPVGNAGVLVLAAVVEEVVFRGLLLTTTRNYPTALVWGVQALTFGGCYAAGGGIAAGLYAGLIGVVFTAYRERDRALWPIVVGHLIIVLILARG